MIYGVIGFVLLLMIVVNLCIRKTNAYQNFYRAIHVVKDVPSEARYDIVAFGSTFAYYAFDLKTYNGHNFSISPQSFTYMGKTIRHFSKNIRKGGIAVIALAGCIFAANSVIQDERSLTYQAFLTPDEFERFDWKRRAAYYLMRYVPLINVKMIKYLFADVQEMYSVRTSVSRDNAIEQARRRIQGWQRDTAVENVFNVERTPELDKCLSESADKLAEIIAELLAKGITPVLTVLPMSECFNEICPESFYDEILYSSIGRLKDKYIRVYDYLKDHELTDMKLFWCADCLNVEGRKRFTERLIEDLEQD